MSNVFFIGDTHFCHKRLATEWRGFASVEDHDEAVVDRWNSVVGKRDLVWHLGDVGFGPRSLNLIARCNGVKKLVLGNHDHFTLEQLGRAFSKVFGVVRVYKHVVLSHVPIHSQELAYRWALNVHGHIHHAERVLTHPGYLCLNADIISLTPAPLEVVTDRLSQLEAA